MPELKVNLSAMHQSFHENMEVGSAGLQTEKSISQESIPTEVPKEVSINTQEESSVYISSTDFHTQNITQEEPSEKLPDIPKCQKISLGSIRKGAHIVQKDQMSHTDEKLDKIQDTEKEIVNHTTMEDYELPSLIKEGDTSYLIPEEEGISKEEESPEEESPEEEGVSKEEESPEEESPEEESPEEEGVSREEESPEEESPEESGDISKENKSDLTQATEIPQDNNTKQESILQEPPTPLKNTQSSQENKKIQEGKEENTISNDTSIKKETPQKDIKEKHAPVKTKTKTKIKKQTSQVRNDKKSEDKKEPSSKVEFGNYHSSFEKQSQKVQKRLKSFQYKRYTPLRAGFTIAFCLSIMAGGVTLGLQNGYIPEKYTANITRLYSESEQAQEIVQNISETIEEKTQDIIPENIQKVVQNPHDKIKDYILKKQEKNADEIKKDKIRDHLLQRYTH